MFLPLDGECFYPWLVILLLVGVSFTSLFSASRLEDQLWEWCKQYTKFGLKCETLWDRTVAHIFTLSSSLFFEMHIDHSDTFD